MRDVRVKDDAGGDERTRESRTWGIRRVIILHRKGSSGIRPAYLQSDSESNSNIVPPIVSLHLPPLLHTPPKKPSQHPHKQHKHPQISKTAPPRSQDTYNTSSPQHA